MNLVDRIKKELDELTEDGVALAISLGDKSHEEYEKALGKKIKKLDFKSHYQRWYSKAYAVVENVLPHRVVDFKTLFQPERRRDIDIERYGIVDYLNGITLTRADSKALVDAKLYQQLQILKACEDGLDSALLNIRQLIHADFLDSEIHESQELLKRGFFRAAGAIAGVAVEKHLNQVCTSHNTLPKKKNPSIGDYNEALKNNDIYDTPTWRFVGRLADIRNLCDHSKEREPTKDEVDEMIKGVEKIVKTIF